MRLLAGGEFRPAGGFIGAGIEEFQRPRPVRPHDVLRVELEILDVRVSKTKPQQGILQARCTTLNQSDEPVQRFVINLVVQRRIFGCCIACVGGWRAPRHSSCVRASRLVLVASKYDG